MGARMVAAAAVLVTMAMLFHGGAAAYNVPKGKWALPMDNNNISKWVQQNTPFKTYTLYFEYDPKKYNVAKVSSKANYDKCIAGAGADLRQTGADEFKLTPGANFFICTKPGRCAAAGGMKLTINAT